MRHDKERLLGLGLGFAQNDEIICVSDKVGTLCVQYPIKVIEDDIGQEWEYDATLKRPQFRCQPE